MCCCVALLWEYLEFLSLLLSHYILDLWLHIHVSLSSNTLMSKLISLTQSLHPLSMASFSAILRALFFSSKSLQMFPIFFLLHHVRSLLQFSTFIKTLVLALDPTDASHDVFTASPLRLSDSHISSNWNILLHGGLSSLERLMRRGVWSNEWQKR